ncbi:MAG: hypothetical protein OXE95_09200 [Chloroflexi bacterium]|nr:hypothetical protein [Chloroflexota bacterium]MCY4247733.1 hypothetical protein [Chloroflexota bacterium]
MSDPLFAGIDGGGSSLRVAIVDARLATIATQSAGTANPSISGREGAQAHIRATVRATLRQAGIAPERIAAAGIGIAGASNLHSKDWLLATLAPVLPSARLVPSSDLEIALVGALGRRHGILLLAGTGSAAYGCAPGGQRLQVGGWGYLLGDEGSGYWMGMQLLRGITAAYDQDIGLTELGAACLDALELETARDLVGWLYRGNEAAPARVAKLARLVLDVARTGDDEAKRLVAAAARHLAKQVEWLRSQLDYPCAPIAFAGGLLEADNALCAAVTRQLNLPEQPKALHSPAIGAALLAQLEWSGA